MIPPSEYFGFKCTAQVHPTSNIQWSIPCSRVDNPLCGQTEPNISGIFKRKELNPFLIYTSTFQVIPWLIVLMCDNLCPLSQSWTKSSSCSPAQNCTTDSALSQQASSPPSLNTSPPIVQLHWKQGIFILQKLYTIFRKLFIHTRINQISKISIQLVIIAYNVLHLMHKDKEINTERFLWVIKKKSIPRVIKFTLVAFIFYIQVLKQAVCMRRAFKSSTKS